MKVQGRDTDVRQHDLCCVRINTYNVNLYRDWQDIKEFKVFRKGRKIGKEEGNVKGGNLDGEINEFGR